MIFTSDFVFHFISPLFFNMQDEQRFLCFAYLSKLSLTVRFINLKNEI